MLGAMKETNSYAKHSASVLNLFLRDCQNHARIVKPKPEGHAYQTKTEPITAYEPSQYRSPFYPPTQGSLVPVYDKRAEIGDRVAIKKESDDHSNAFPSTYFFPLDSSTFHHQPSAEYSQRSWHNEYNDDMDLDGSYDSKRWRVCQDGAGFHEALYILLRFIIWISLIPYTTLFFSKTYKNVGMGCT